jgi:hypothetical protein
MAIRKRCVELRSQGWTHAAIAREMGVAYNTARRYALELDRRRQTPPCPQCGGELRRRPEGWLCLGCGAPVSRWAVMSDAQRAQGQAASLRSQRRRQRAIRSMIREAKDRPCADCGVRLVAAAMHLDHVRGTKSFAVCEWSRHTIRPARVAEEIAKCDVRCANCHAVKHALP